MAYRKSESAIPVFLFLALTLIFIPCIILILIMLRRRRQSAQSEQFRAETAERVAANLHRWSKQAPIEMGDIPVPPPPPPKPAPSVSPIRSMSSGRNNRPVQTMFGTQDMNMNMNSMQEVDLGTYPAPQRQTQNFSQPSAAYPPRTTSLSAPNRGSDTSLRHFPAPPASPRYDLHSAMQGEGSPVSVKPGSERKTSESMSDAPRVKSQHVSPGKSHGGIVEMVHYPVDDGYYARGEQPARWV